MAYIQGAARSQQTLFPVTLDELVRKIICVAPESAHAQKTATHGDDPRRLWGGNVGHSISGAASAAWDLSP